VGGPYGVGSRISIAYTRAMVDAAISGRLEGVAWRTDPVFGIEVPTECPGVPTEILDQRSTWASPSEYDHRARELAERFIRNFAQFKDVSKEISQAGPRLG
ncbi:MAG TPA: phosphoenolpyruvate carboxykinase (ATP), partial [Armatimonadota bacterium]|nr:phosphoenolpyruvate carboxykinase (ATP) [Armatimonadota bacterium]